MGIEGRHLIDGNSGTGEAAHRFAVERAAAAVGALTRPVAVLEELDLGDLRGTLVAAALGALGME